MEHAGFIEIKGGGAEAWRRFREDRPDVPAAILILAALESYRRGKWVPRAGVARRHFGEGAEGATVPEWGPWDATIGAFERLPMEGPSVQDFRQALLRDGGLHAVGYSDFVADAVASLEAGAWSLPEGGR